MLVNWAYLIHDFEKRTLSVFDPDKVDIHILPYTLRPLGIQGGSLRIVIAQFNDQGYEIVQTSFYFI